MQHQIAVLLGHLFSGLKGCALVSNLYSYAQHGDPDVKTLVKHVLNQVYRPINTLLNAWIFEGQLQDRFNEVRTGVAAMIEEWVL